MYACVLSIVMTEWFINTNGIRRAREFAYEFCCRSLWIQWQDFVSKMKMKRGTRAELYKNKQEAFHKRGRLIREQAEAEAMYDLKSVRQSRKIKKAKLRRGLKRAGAETVFENKLNAQSPDEPIDDASDDDKDTAAVQQGDDAQLAAVETVDKTAAVETVVETELAEPMDGIDGAEGPASQNGAEEIDAAEDGIHPDVSGAVVGILQAIEADANSVESLRLIDGLQRELDQLRGLLFELDSAVKSRRLADPDDPELSALVERAFQTRVHCTELEEALLSEERSHQSSISAAASTSAEDATPNFGGESEEEEEGQEQEPPRPSKYSKLLLNARANIDSSACHLSVLHRRNNEMTAEIERMREFQLQLQRLAASRGKEFQQHLQAMKSQGMEAALLAGDAAKKQLWAMLQQFCGAVGIALDSVKRTRHRNTCILAFLRFARPVQIRKARRWFAMCNMKAKFGTWRRYNALMKSIRETAHVRFRCNYSCFNRWKRATRLTRIYRTRGLRWEILRRKHLLCLYSVWMDDSPMDSAHYNRYTCLAKWAEYTQQQVSRRSAVTMRNAIVHRRHLRRAFMALFLGLKPVHQGESAADGYVELNFMADTQLWQYMLRSEIHLNSRRQRRIHQFYRRRSKTSALKAARKMPRQQLQRARASILAQQKHDQAAILAKYATDRQLHSMWPIIFQMRSSKELGSWELSKESLVRYASSIQMSKMPQLWPIIRSSWIGIGTILWVLRARLRIQARTHAYEKLVRQARANQLYV